MKLHTIEKRMIPSTGRDIRILIMRPTKNAKPKEQTPGILWIHGGGHLFGMHKKILLSRARDLVDKHGAVVVALNTEPRSSIPFQPTWKTATPRCSTSRPILKDWE